MKKKLIIVLIFVSYMIFGMDVDIENLKFSGLRISLNKDVSADESETGYNYNIVYSPILPAGAIYRIIDNITGKEAIIQVGLLTVDKSPYNLYLPDYLYDFFEKPYDRKPDNLILNLKFLAWNKDGESSQFLNIQTLVVPPENSFEELKKNGSDKVYIQIGSFKYYQNAYPLITEMLPFLELKPNFYMVNKKIKKGENEESFYRIYAGPYTKETAVNLMRFINEKKNSKVYIQESNKIIEENKAGVVK